MENSTIWRCISYWKCGECPACHVSLLEGSPWKIIGPIGSRIAFQSHHFSGVNSLLNFGVERVVLLMEENSPVDRSVYAKKSWMCWVGDVLLSTGKSPLKQQVWDEILHFFFQPRTEQASLSWYIEETLLELKILIRGSLCHYVQGCIHPKWCRISSKRFFGEF